MPGACFTCPFSQAGAHRLDRWAYAGNLEPLLPRHPETAFTETRRLRHDGWTPEKKRLFLERYAQCGIFVEACEAAGMSARAAYNLRDRDPLFAAGLEAACVKARAPLADDLYSRSHNGVVERIYKDGVIVAERHRYDNRLSMAVLNRLDARIDRAEERGSPHLALVARWDEYLDAMGDDRRGDGMALLAPPESAPSAELQENARDRELRELHLEEEAESQEDPHLVWHDHEGAWTDYPPPADFDGEEVGEYGDKDYRRTLTAAEQAAMDAEEAKERAQKRAHAETLRDAFFFGTEPEEEEEAEEEEESEDADENENEGGIEPVGVGENAPAEEPPVQKVDGKPSPQRRLGSQDEIAPGRAEIPCDARPGRRARRRRRAGAT